MIQSALDGITAEPLLGGREAARARDGLARLARGLRGPITPLGWSLGSGAAGVAVALATAAVALDDDDLARAARRTLDEAVEAIRLEGRRASVGLFSGVAGVAWAHEYCARLGCGVTDTADLDGLLAARLAGGASSTGWGLGHGLAGAALYSLDRGDRALVRIAVDALDRSRDEQGRWLSDSVIVFGRAVPGLPHSFAEPSLTHGLAGLVGVLAWAARSGSLPDPSLLDDAAGQLVAAVEAEPGRDPVAWCGGGTGIAAGVVAALPLIAHHGVGVLAARLLADAAAAPVAASRGLGLCHGAAGAACALRRLASATGDARAWHAARRWATVVVDAVSGDIGDGIGDAIADAIADRVGMLQGWAGVVVALASLTGGDTGWERVLMLP